MGELVLSAEDLHFKSGSIALALENVSNAYFDHFTIAHLPCSSNTMDERPALDVQIKTNRFYETYKNDMEEIWQYSEED